MSLVFVAATPTVLHEWLNELRTVIAETIMTIDSRWLTKEWIQYLKNNRIVELTSDPATGKLTYRRGVTPADLSKFLETKTDFTPEQISAAINQGVTRKSSNLPSGNTTQQQQTSNQEKPAPEEKPQQSQQPRKPHVRLKSVNEEFTDIDSIHITEDDIASIFSILTAAPTSKKAKSDKPQKQKKELSQEKRTEELNKLIGVVRDTMSDTQRKSLWRILKNA